MQKLATGKHNPKNSTAYEDNVMALQKLTSYWHERAQNAGVNTDREEVFAEVCLAFSKARQNYDPSTGYRFSTFYYTAVKNELYKWVSKQMRTDNYGINVSIDQAIGADNEESSNRLGEFAIANEYCVYEEEDLKESTIIAFNKLSETAQKAVAWMIDPPDILERELQGGRAKAKFSTDKIGIKRMGKVDVGMDMVLQLLSKLTGMDEEMKKRVRMEINEFKREISA